MARRKYFFLNLKNIGMKQVVHMSIDEKYVT